MLHKHAGNSRFFSPSPAGACHHQSPCQPDHSLLLCRVLLPHDAEIQGKRKEDPASTYKDPLDVSTRWFSLKSFDTRAGGKYTLYVTLHQSVLDTIATPHWSVLIEFNVLVSPSLPHRTPFEHSLTLSCSFKEPSSTSNPSPTNTTS